MTRLRRPSAPLLRDSNASIQSRPVRRRDADQPSLPFDAMPSRVEPCLALLKQTVPHGPDWLYEVKWDGYRLAIHIEPKSIRILTRGGHDWTHRFPTIGAGARELGVSTCILDGEAIILNEEGRSDFGALQRSLGGRGGKRVSTESIFCAFDLLYLDGHDLTRTELSVRRHLLEDLIPETDDAAIRFSQELDLGSEELLEHACQLGLEGIIAKRRDSPYRSGRLGDWQKIKCVQSASFMIVGYEESVSTRGGLGSLLLAGRKGHDWIYVGSVGTGFNRTEAEYLRKTLNSLQTKKPVVPLKGKRLVFSQPTLIAEIEFRGWTHEGSLRHPSYKGLREIQDNAAVFDMNRCD
ncbi:non-homologous end-joining DNA ligase (plasmid) [Rhizobium bangladeshense]|uniref:non-homologous end-joining DNA ligase n=1 Tax=Rhizobium bangladeshense TaxID=1138189 RepID=UPI001A998DE7|nr:non-homologous end-joining DNA ligase [Rhizobium bangladeshense]MBX4868529.1 ATP-dependent DNA ligase [Rhizobium bangladeshense]MBX4920243.1 ATP-dependent DNA ligase [Rhizobium bangladeshense]QSY97422.1 non-homologous end-joining DNA ligase [Rhizobium bangladeshense]